MFLDPSPTPLDMRFRVGPFPVRVSPWFFLGMFILGFGLTAQGPVPLLLFIACGFVAILVHELGHAIMARGFGRPSTVNLIMFGGYAEYHDGAPPAGWRRLLTALGGPIAGLTFALALYASNQSVGWAERHWLLALIYFFSLLLNIVWSLFNLLPLWPLDGGRALREVLYILGLRRPDVPTHYAGMVGGGTLLLMCLAAAFNPDHPLIRGVPFVRASLWMIFIFGFIAYQNWQMLQFYGRFGTPDEDESDRWRSYR